MLAPRPLLVTNELVLYCANGRQAVANLRPQVVPKPEIFANHFAN
jgi:hypothetical protein